MQIYRLSITIGNNNCFFSIKKNSAQSKFPKLNYHAEYLIINRLPLNKFASGFTFFQLFLKKFLTVLGNITACKNIRYSNTQ